MELRVFLFLLSAAFSVNILFYPGQGLAEEKEPYTLDKSITEALANNWELRAKKEKIAQASHIKKQALAEFFPKFSTSYGYTRFSEVNLSDPISVGGLTVPGRPLNCRDNYQLRATLKQPVFTGFALISSLNLAELGVDQSETELDLEKLDIAMKVKEAYFQILEADKFREVADKAVNSLKSHVDVARSFYEVGMIPVNDLLKAEVELANAQHDLVKAANGSRLARAFFNVVLSRPIEDKVEVMDILEYKPYTGEFCDYVEKALEERPEMKLLEVSILKADQQIRLAKSKLYPEVAFTYDYIKEGDDPDVSGSPFHDSSSWQAMVGLSWTFWEWGKTHYSVREKENFKEELLKTKRAMEDNIQLELKDAVLGLEQAEKNIPTTRKAVAQAEENLRVSRERYKAQVTTSTEVLDAQTLLTQASTNYYSALYDHSLAKARLLRAIGTY